jgi:biotin carboxyl carrier protein
MNGVGVRQFPDYRTGVAYTADTIIGGYPGIMSALRAGKPYAPKYRPAIVSDFSKWVSGQRTGREDYGHKILGMSVAPRAQFPVTGNKGVSRNNPPSNRNEIDLSDIMYILDDGDDFWDLIQAKPEEFPEMAAPVSEPHPMNFATTKGKMLIPGGKGTHITDGLDLNRGRKTAVDIMANPGTPVAAPVSGTVFRHGSAQGGEALYLRDRAGKIHWFGHITNRVPVGTKVKRGQRIADISPDHARPHLHYDREI